jgi:hypothetical protein
MTDENKPVETVVETVEETKPVETVEETVETVEDTKPEESTLKVDFEGESVELPYTIAKKLMDQRQKMKELSKKELEYNKKIEELSNREKILKQNLAQAIEKKSLDENIEMQDMIEAKVGAYKSRVIDAEIKSTLNSIDTFLPQATDDVMSLLKANHKFELSEDGSKIVSGEKELKEVVEEFVKSKPIYQRVSVANGGFGKSGVPKTNVKTPTSSKDDLAKGLASMFGR